MPKKYSSDIGFVSTKTVRLPGFTTYFGHTFPYVDINYLTLGTLNESKNNVILVAHALSGNALVAGMDEQTGAVGWWEDYVGPGKAIDTNKFYVICSNVIGGCNGSTGPTSINPETNQPYNMSFPPITIQDMVKAQALLLDYLGIQKLFAVIGGSMGGMQALTWALHYPDLVHLCIPIATCMAHNAMQIAFNEVGRQAIMSDPNWNQGNYTPDKRPEHGLAVARMIGHITYLSAEIMEKKFGRKIQRNPLPTDIFPVFFSVESYLHYQGESFVKRFDPNSYLYITKALDMFDWFQGIENPEDALDKIKSKFLVISFDSDWLYPPEQSKQIVRLLKRANKSVTYMNLNTNYGHDSFLIPNKELSTVIASFLDLEFNLYSKMGETLHAL
ncbi:MAG: homoserine O-acetyltransferase [Leptospiraceae bacterium]|nr:homoserine O-acetyltransferase [Leptospiraceae bacterium]MDW7975810.1 homoserine O-acetyltransferase [Leptospiraceae bacterium]